MITAFRGILSTVARKTVLQRISWSRDLFLLRRDEDEKSPPLSHRISQVDIRACIHRLSKAKVIVILFPSR